MFLAILLAFITTASAQDVPIDCESCVAINGTCFNVTEVLELEAPFRKHVVIHKLAIHRSENKLYYSFEPNIEDPEYYKIGFINLDRQNESGIISGQNIAMNFGTFDIDQDNGMIYLGGDDGVFVLDSNTNKLGHYSSRGDTIRYIFYKNNVYFVKYDVKGITVKKGDNFNTLLEDIPIKMFVVNKYDVIVFLNNFGLFVGKGESVHKVSKNAFFRGLTVDLDGNIFAWWIDGVYKVIVERTLHDAKVVKFANLPSIGSLTFDNDNNMLFTVDKSLYRLTQTDYNCNV